jgi:hypothetical protein
VAAEGRKLPKLPRKLVSVLSREEVPSLAESPRRRSCCSLPRRSTRPPGSRWITGRPAGRDRRLAPACDVGLPELGPPALFDW